eukprot:scaffold841_cov397-Prasinococcus_capsulatus_cf.AAC.1
MHVLLRAPGVDKTDWGPPRARCSGSWRSPAVRPGRYVQARTPAVGTVRLTPSQREGSNERTNEGTNEGRKEGRRMTTPRSFVRPNVADAVRGKGRIRTLRAAAQVECCAAGHA